MVPLYAYLCGVVTSHDQCYNSDWYKGRLHKTKSHYIDVRSGPTVITSVTVHTCAQLKTLTNKLLAKQKCIEVVAMSR